MTKAQLKEVMLQVARGLRIEAETGEECDESRALEKYAEDLERAALAPAQAGKVGKP